MRCTYHRLKDSSPNCTGGNKSSTFLCFPLVYILSPSVFLLVLLSVFLPLAAIPFLVVVLRLQVKVPVVVDVVVITVVNGDDFSWCSSIHDCPVDGGVCENQSMNTIRE